MIAHQNIKQLFKDYTTSFHGLTEKEAKRRLMKYGENQIEGKKRRPLIFEFLDEFKDLMVMILIIASGISALGGEYSDAGVIFFIVLLNATIGFIQKFKAEKAIEALKKMVAPRAKVIRNGKIQDIEAKYLVPGDILVIHEGDRVGADARIIEENEVEADESTLTGESIPVKKYVEVSKNKMQNESVTECSIFMGTNITHGTGKAIIISTGMNTQFGKIAHLTSTTQKDKSPLQKELHKIGIFVGKITLVISAILFAVGYFLQNIPFIKAFLFAASVAVAAVPEGLPATITIALAIGVQKLARKNAIMKQLSSVETLGSTTVICSDKTGTLTKNEMTVTKLYAPGYEIDVSGVGYKPEGCLKIRGQKRFNSEPVEGYVVCNKSDNHLKDFEQFTAKDLEKEIPEAFKIIELITRIAILCNNTFLTQKQKMWHIIGDPTEGALITLAEKAGFTVKKTNEKYQRIYEIPFDSQRKLMTTINQNTKNQRIEAYTKGAPDEIVKICSHIITYEGKIKKLTPQAKTEILEKNSAMARKALRVLGLAYKKFPKDTKPLPKYHKEIVEKNLIFVGLIGMIDPPRPEVKEAIKLTKTAGIKTYVVTGDHFLTASAIAKELELIHQGNEPRIIEGGELKKLSERELLKIFKTYSEILFARVSPEDKLKIVNALKKQGEVVAMTGDGVNDAPALKRADIGVAMGITGTDVSKEAANMVLTDDSYATIVTAIKEGRTIYRNMKKFIFYIFSSNIGELFTIFAAIILALPSPLTTILILAVNVGTDILPALALGVDPSEKNVMNQQPRKQKDHIMGKNFVIHFVFLGILIGIIVTGTFIWELFNYGWVWGEKLPENNIAYLKSSTTAFVSLVLIQLVNTFNARSRTESICTLGFFNNRWLIGAILISLGIVYALVEIEFFQNYMHTTSLSPQEWLIITGTSCIIVVVEEIRKWMYRRRVRAAYSEAK